eukprot:3315303-Prymnesium_polylepis.1
MQLLLALPASGVKLLSAVIAAVAAVFDHGRQAAIDHDGELVRVGRRVVTRPDEHRHAAEAMRGDGGRHRFATAVHRAEAARAALSDVDELVEVDVSFAP